MGKNVRAVRAFFSTFYPEVAQEILRKLRTHYGEAIHVSRSKVVQELYYVEIKCEEIDLKEAAARIYGLLEEAAKTGDVYGIKVYTVPPDHPEENASSAG